tara:strand:- start:3923 stop:4942 length:1020 start_codon:yes stop_codon:yes gene_type:complete
MRIAVLATSALALAISVPVLAQPGNGNGNGNGAAKADRGPGNGNGNGNAGRGEGNQRGGPPAMRGNGNGNGQGNAGPPAIQRGNAQNGGQGNGQNFGNADRLRDRVKQNVDRLERQIERRVERRVDDIADRVGDRIEGRLFADFDRNDRAVRGFCPPGLAKKNNGCQPPGQAKRLQSQRFGGYYGAIDPRFAGDDWRYYDGYAYRPSNGGLIESLIPLVGGALFQGNQWPTSYDSYRAPAYYGEYFGQNPGNQYYYADRTLFSVDPEDRAITGIAALLTGNDISVGQPLPAGYSVYNVPYQYRDQYVDGPEAMYRYSDGYVYRVDPETRLVAAVIDLLT